MECDPTRVCELLVELGDVELLGVEDEAGEPLRNQPSKSGHDPRITTDRGYDSAAVRRACADKGITDVVCAKKRPRGTAKAAVSVPLGMRWTIERTNSWLSNFGQLRRNTDRRSPHRRAQLALAIALILTAKLIDWRNRWSPQP